MDDKLNTKLGDLDLSVRTMSVFNMYGMRTVGDVAKRDQSELLRMNNFGRKSFNEVCEAFRSLGVQLRWGPARKYVSFRLDADIYEKVILSGKANSRMLEAELERIVSEAVRDIPAIGDLPMRLERLERAVFGKDA